MRLVSISEAKNGLSSVLENVRAGETVLITERGVPIARIGPVAMSSDPTGRSSRLARAGLARPGNGSSLSVLQETPGVSTPKGSSIVEMALEERESSW